jgi:hypothetical protein
MEHNHPESFARETRESHENEEVIEQQIESELNAEHRDLRSNFIRQFCLRVSPRALRIKPIFLSVLIGVIRG